MHRRAWFSFAILAAAACRGQPAAPPVTALPEMPEPPPRIVDRGPDPGPCTRPAEESSLPVTLLDVHPTLDGQPVKHAFPAEQQVETGVPFYLELPAGVSADVVQLRYKPFGATRYMKMTMQRLGSGFAAEVPCEDVSTTGALKFFIALLDGDGKAFDSIGTPREPLQVMIRNEIEGGPPRLPGKPLPRSCPYECHYYGSP